MVTNKTNKVKGHDLFFYRIGMKEHGTSYHLPYFLLRVYQVMPLPRYPYTHDPDFHQLLHIHYIPAYSTGWQVSGHHTTLSYVI